MKTTKKVLLTLGLSSLITVAHAAVYTVNTVDNTDFSAGKTNLVAALKALKDGDTVRFSIPGSGVHTLATPPDGYPLITANNITIDGYSQPGSSPNTSSIHSANNAQIMICLSSVNGNALSMYSSVTNAAGMDYPNLGFGDGEQAILGFFRATNVWVKGLALLAAFQTSTSYKPGGDCKTICFAPDAADVSDQACQNFHVSGCWFGVDPATRQVAYMPDGTTLATPTICIATYKTGTNGTPGSSFTNNVEVSSSGTIGVAAGSANPRAEFNVFVTGYGLDSQGGPFRISGNFWNVLPDGTTLADISVLDGGAAKGDAYVEFGGGHDILIGTDGDGINDADEGNVFGSYALGGESIYYYGSQLNTVIAGNTFGVDVTGKTFGVGQLTKLVHHFSHDALCQVRFGSDFNGVSDALEANTVVDSLLFDNDSASANTNTHWISVRGNSLVNTATPNGSTPPLGDGQTIDDGGDLYTNFVDVSGASGTLAVIPVIGAGTTTSFLVGTCGKPAGDPFTRVIADLYAADTTAGVAPQGQKWLASFVDNSSADLDSKVGSFKFALPAGLVASGTKVTIAVTYSGDPQPVINAIRHTGAQTTLTVTNGTAAGYPILQSATVAGPYTSQIAILNGSSGTFTDNSPSSFYKAVGASSSGQTTPFSALFTMP